MPANVILDIPAELVLGARLNDRVPAADQRRQRREVEEILQRLRTQPGVILADEVGMGKTFVALAVAYSVGVQSRMGPVLVMVPPNLIDKWEQDLRAFCELYLTGANPVCCHDVLPAERRRPDVLRYGRARHSLDLLKLLDDQPNIRAHLVFVAQGAMSRNQTDWWIRLALIRETFRRHGRREQLKKVHRQIHRFLGGLLRAKIHERATEAREDIWDELLGSDPRDWKDLYNSSLSEGRQPLDDDPVPEAVRKAIARIDLKGFADALSEMPVRTSSYLEERLRDARHALKEVEGEVWKQILAQARWRSPLLVMDEAHHLKNPGTALARQLQSPDSDADLKTGDGALARAFTRMLFLTATPFQLGHNELVRVLERFGDVRWDEETFGPKDAFENGLLQLSESLTESQRTAITLQRCWARLRDDDRIDGEDRNAWWAQLRKMSRGTLTPRQRALVDAFDAAEQRRREAEQRLRPWIVRHNKGRTWSETSILRRQRLNGAGLIDQSLRTGIEVPAEQLLPFFLAARSATQPGKDLLGEALCSSYEAFRYTRRRGEAARDDAEGPEERADLTHSQWFLRQFDEVLNRQSGSVHPKIAATVRKVVDLWSTGEKVLVFAFYRRTCRALRLHISEAIERSLKTLARRRLAGAGRPASDGDIDRIIDSVQNRFFDRVEAPGRKALDQALAEIVEDHEAALEQAGVHGDARDELIDVMRRFLRVTTTLVRAFPIHQHDSLDPHLAVRSMLDAKDDSDVSWHDKFHEFLRFLLESCTAYERTEYLAAARRTQTGGIRVETKEEEDEASDAGAVALANIQEATGGTNRDTRSRLMRAFNTPFFPDILVCSQVMGEGVDLHRYCRHVIHHDLAWNPSSIEQRTGRVDRLGCKAEGRHPIHVYLPYLAGTADERQYMVMNDREHWFQIVMGQEAVAKLIPDDSEAAGVELPDEFEHGLSFCLGLS